MRQALHIFKKDIRHLRWEIALTLLLTAVFAYSDITASQRPEGDQDLTLKGLLALSWAYLIGRVIHSEALPGTKQFWLTRPYSHKSLFAAKMLFLLTFLTLPMMISDTVILAKTGLVPSEHLSGLLWEQVIRWLVLIGPAMAVSAITAGIAEQSGSLLLGLTFGFCVIELGQNRSTTWGQEEWLRNSIACAFVGASAASIVVFQYFWRKTMTARVATASLVGLGSLIVFLPPVADSHMDSAASLGAMLDRSIPPGTGTPDGQLGVLAPRVDIPLRLTGLKEGLTPWADLGWVTITGIPEPEERDNHPWPFGWEVVNGTRLRQLMIIDASFLDHIKNEPVRLHSSLTLTLVRNRTTTVLSQRGMTAVPGIGLCDPLLSCWSAFRTPRDLVTDNWTGSKADFTSRSPFPAEFGISPVVALYRPGPRMTMPNQVVVTTAEPIELVRYEFDLDNVRLADFEIH